MPAAPLTPSEQTVVAQASRLLDGGRPREAAEAVAPLIAGGCRHPDPLMLYSAACEALGLARDALGAAQAALQASPERADLWASVGRLLHEQGRHAEGAAMLERSVALDPRNPSFWYNLGLAANGAGLADRAGEALARAAELAPDWALAWGGLGFFHEQAGDLERAEQCLRRALGLDPNLASSRHRLAVLLRRLDRRDEALALTERAALPETRLLRAHLLAELGRAEAVAAYRSVLKDSPQLLDGHETFARLMPQLGRPEEALQTYRAALDAAPTLELSLSALASARDIRATDTLLEWTAEARRRFGDLPDLLAFEGLGIAQAGDTTGALALLEPLAAAGHGAVLGHCAYLRLQLGDPKGAERHALAATERNFTDQTAWACLTIAWRLLEDPRERWLADYERLVMPIELEPPPGFASSEEFMAAVAGELHALHNTTDHPADQSLRNGTQTRGVLFERRSPMVTALATAIDHQVGRRLSALTPDPGHPFLGRLSAWPRFAGSWSVRLRSGGFHVGHIHHEGWLSSALYVELPPGMAEAEPGTASPGALVFGVPHHELGIDVPPRRIEQPRVGRLVVFPSYFWHGTLPFDSDAQRMTVAFDMVPG